MKTAIMLTLIICASKIYACPSGDCGDCRIWVNGVCTWQCQGCQSCWNDICVDDNENCYGCLDCSGGYCTPNQANCDNSSLACKGECAANGNCMDDDGDCMVCENCHHNVCEDDCPGCQDCIDDVCVNIDENCFGCQSCNTYCEDNDDECNVNGAECYKCMAGLCSPDTSQCPGRHPDEGGCQVCWVDGTCFDNPNYCIGCQGCQDGVCSDEYGECSIPGQHCEGYLCVDD